MTDAKLEKVRKLLALAESPGATAAEAEAFTAKAAHLMAEHGIDEALLADTPGHGDISNRIIRFYAPYVRDKCTLACGIADAMRCKAVILGSEPSLSVHVFGLEADVASVEMLTTSLLLQGARELSRTEIPRRENVAAYRRSWWAGYSAAVHARLSEITAATVTEAEEHRAPGSPSVELVLADRSHEIDDAVDEAYPRRHAATRRRLSGGGARDGFASGHQVDLGVGFALEG